MVGIATSVPCSLWVCQVFVCSPLELQPWIINRRHTNQQATLHILNCMAHRVKSTVHYLRPTSKNGLVYIKNEWPILPSGSLLLSPGQMQPALWPRRKTSATCSYLADLHPGTSRIACWETHILSYNAYCTTVNILLLCVESFCAVFFSQMTKSNEMYVGPDVCFSWYVFWKEERVLSAMGCLTKYCWWRFSY